MMRSVVLTTNFTNSTNVGYVSHSLDLLYSWFVNFMMRSVVLTTNFTNPTNVGCVRHSANYFSLVSGSMTLAQLDELR